MDPPTKVSIILAVVAVHALLLMRLSSRGHRSSHAALRLFLWGACAVYLPLMSYVLSYLTTFLSSLHMDIWLALTSVVLIQLLKADMAALAVAAVASPLAGEDADFLKIRPSMESLVYSFWVAGLVVYNTIQHYPEYFSLTFFMLLLALWVLGVCRMVLRFAAFKRAKSSFALGRNAQLIDGYMMQLRQDGSFESSEEQLPAAVPRPIVTGERNRDVEESPLGYSVKRSALEDEPRRLVTLDRVWSESDPVLVPELKDLCLSMALFKCLRRRFAGYRLAEAGSSWALGFVRDGLLGREDDHDRMFWVMAGELSFASDFYYSALPVASLGTLFAALHFFLSMLIFVSLCGLLLLFVLVPSPFYLFSSLLVAPVLAMVTACTEILEMVAGVRSNWTKISIIGHYIRCRHCCVRRIFSCLLRCKSQKHWKDEIGQIELLKPSLFCKQSWARLFKQLFLRRKNRNKPVIKVPPEVKAAVLSSFRSSGGQLSDGTATVRRRCQAFRHDNDITWACHGGEVTTTTDTILVWHIATSLFEIRCSSQRASSSSTRTASMLVARSLSCYRTYLVAEAPDLLPDISAWTKSRHEAVKKNLEAVSRPSGAVQEADLYGHLIDSFGGESSHEVLKKGSKLGKQLVEEAERTREGEAGAGGEEVVWELLAELWSEMVLYLAPSDNVKGHIETLQRGGELITLLWALLLHAGITTRLARHVPEP